MLIELVVNTNRQFDLMGKDLPEGYPKLGEIGQQMVDVVTKYYEDAMIKRDYPVLLNIRWYTGMIRQANLIFGETEVSGKLLQFLDGNRFEMIVDADAELGKDGQTIQVKMKGS